MDNDAVIRKTRGKDRQPRKKRTDKSVQPETGENSKFLMHDMKLYKLPPVDMEDQNAVQQRIDTYFYICAEDDVKPSVASLALAFNVSRFTLFDWISNRQGVIKHPEVINTLKTAYNLINSYYEHMMNNGRINPVSGIFLMKNNMGYKDTTDYIVTTGNNTDPSLQDISDKAGLLSD